MTETIEEEALRRVNALGGKWKAHEVDRIGNFDVICALITEHRATKAELEAFRREVSEAVVFALKVYGGHRSALVLLHRFIIPQPDPLVEAWNDAFGHGAGLLMVGQLKAALADRGLEIVKKEPNE